MFCKNKIIFLKHCILYFWQGSEYTHNKYSLTCTVDLCYVLYVTYSQPRHLQKPVCYWKLRHINVLFRRIYSHIVAHLEPCVNIAYSEPCNIQKPIKFRTRIYSKLCQWIFWHTQKAVQHLHIESFTIFRTSRYLERTKAYSEPCQISKMEGLKHLVKGYNCSSTTFHLSNLKRFWACLHLNNS